MVSFGDLKMRRGRGGLGGKKKRTAIVIRQEGDQGAGKMVIGN